MKSSLSKIANKNYKFPELPIVKGVKFAAINAGIKQNDREDVMLAHLISGTVLAGVFTKSKTRAPSVLDCQTKINIPSNSEAAIIVNSGNANAFTGDNGKLAVTKITQSVAETLSIDLNRVFSCSTGVIGEKLPCEKIIKSLEPLKQGLCQGNIYKAAKAIMTTDTFPKGAFKTIKTDKGNVNIVGIAKGSGMIAPNMGTMLSYIFTDAVINQTSLQEILVEINEATFNSITVDSDTSTSDAVLIAATGTSNIELESNKQKFKAALYSVMLELAHHIVRDGEGASKFIEISVIGARSHKEAKTHAMAIGNSPLVKTAVFGEDPNWGRIIMGIGKSGASVDIKKIRVWLGTLLVTENGEVSRKYVENEAKSYMKNDKINITVDLGLASGAAKIWTCDLTHQYVSINADYRS